MSDEIAFLVFMGMFTFVFALKTVEDLWFIFYTITTSACFAVAVRLALTHG